MLAQGSDLEIFQLEVYCVVRHPNFEECFALGCEKWSMRAMIEEDAFCCADLAVITANGMRFRA